MKSFLNFFLVGKFSTIIVLNFSSSSTNFVLLNFSNFSVRSGQKSRSMKTMFKNYLACCIVKIENFIKKLLDFEKYFDNVKK